MEKADPARKSDNPHLQKALEAHDTLTEQFRQYIIDERRKLGVPMEDDWGITKIGYFRHMFWGNIVVRRAGIRFLIVECRQGRQGMVNNVLPTAYVRLSCASDPRHARPRRRGIRWRRENRRPAFA